MRRVTSRYVRIVYWFNRPPYGKYAAAALLLIVGAYAEFRPDPTAVHPFARQDIAAGALLDPSLFVERPAPEGMFAPVEIEGRAAYHLTAGDPLLASAVGTEASIPRGWWALQVPLPDSAEVGMAVRLVLRPTDPTANPPVVRGVVIEAPDRAADPLGFESPSGLVAVPEQDAAPAAVAVADRRVTVLLTP